MKNTKTVNSTKSIMFVIILALLGIVPFLIPTFELRIATGILMWVGLAQSWNMLGGYMGYISFGHGASFGLGAYITAMLMTNMNMPFLPALLIAGVLTYIFAVIVGYPTLRLNGTYFAIGTWAFAEMMRQLILVLPVTGGPDGLRLPALLNENLFYYIMLGLALLAFIVGYFVFEKSDFGLKVKAIREEETASSTLGLNTTAIKNQVFALSSLIAGIIGGSYAYWITYIHPDSVLGPIITDQMVIMVLLGGIGTLFGPVIGAFVLYLGNQIIWVNWGQSSAYLVILGLAICFVILFLPEGLLSLLRLKGDNKNRTLVRLFSSLRKRKLDSE